MTKVSTKEPRINRIILLRVKFEYKTAGGMPFRQFYTNISKFSTKHVGFYIIYHPSNQPLTFCT